MRAGQASLLLKFDKIIQSNPHLPHNFIEEEMPNYPLPNLTSILKLCPQNKEEIMCALKANENQFPELNKQLKTLCGIKTIARINLYTKTMNILRTELHREMIHNSDIIDLEKKIYVPQKYIGFFAYEKGKVQEQVYLASSGAGPCVILTFHMKISEFYTFNVLTHLDSDYNNYNNLVSYFRQIKSKFPANRQSLIASVIISSTDHQNLEDNIYSALLTVFGTEVRVDPYFSADGVIDAGIDVVTGMIFKYSEGHEYAKSDVKNPLKKVLGFSKYVNESELYYLQYDDEVGACRIGNEYLWTVDKGFIKYKKMSTPDVNPENCE